jgi:hypothetical protein
MSNVVNFPKPRLSGPAVVNLYGSQPVVHVWTGSDWEVLSVSWDEVEIRFGAKTISFSPPSNELPIAHIKE